MKVRAIATASVASAFVLAGAHGASAAQMVMLPDLAATHFEAGPPSLPAGTKMAMVQGDPAKPGPFVLRFVFPAHADIPPHTHSADENLTILSGEIYHEVGPKMDKSAGHLIKTGGFVYLPAAMPHSLWTTDKPVEVQVTGTGPFGLNFVNPNDDPGKAKRS